MLGWVGGKSELFVLLFLKSAILFWPCVIVACFQAALKNKCL